MSANFRIILSSTSEINQRPQISRSVADYFEEFVIENILKEKKIIISSQWQYELVLTFIDESKRYTSNYIYMAGSPTTVTKEKVRIYDLLIPTKLIMLKHNKYHAIVELIYEAICLFFTKTFKKVDQLFLKKVSSNIDFSYLNNIPFPAPLVEQHFLGDIVIDGRVENQLDNFFQE